MNIKFKREERYVVFKLTDLCNSLKGDEIRQLAMEYAEQRRLKGKPPLECVVVESDWPEYEPTWKAIEARMTGSPEESAIQTAARIMNIELIRELDTLRAKVEATEKQEPVARFNWSKGELEWLRPWNYRTMDMKPLYLAPGAQGEKK